VTLAAAAFRGGDAGDLQLERGRKTTIKDALIGMWDNKSFAFESHVDLGGAVTGSVVSFGGAYQVRVTNNTRHRLEDAILSYSGASVKIGTLGPGQDWSGQVSRGGERLSSRLGPVYDSFSAGRSTSGRIKAALANAVSANEMGLGGNPPLLFSAWFSDSVQGLTLEGERPHLEGQNLLVVHLPSAGPGGQQPFRPSARLPANPPPFSPGGGGFSLPPPTFGGANANSLNSQAYTLAGAGRLNEALNTAYRALALAPNDGNILDTVAEMHQRLKQYPQAATYYQRALAQQGGGGLPETHVKYGETLLQLKRKSEAITHFQTASARDYGTWGTRARANLARLGITAQILPGNPRSPSQPTSTITIAPGAQIPPMPATPGRGRRRILQPQLGGGTKLIIQEWDNSPTGMSQSQSEQFIPAGRPIPP
jgi:hypothetical protein